MSFNPQPQKSAHHHEKKKECPFCVGCCYPATTTLVKIRWNDVSTLVLWGEKYFALSKKMAPPPVDIVERSEGLEFFDAGHCIHWENLLEVAERMVNFTNAHNGCEAIMKEET